MQGIYITRWKKIKDFIDTYNKDDLAPTAFFAQARINEIKGEYDDAIADGSPTIAKDLSNHSQGFKVYICAFFGLKFALSGRYSYPLGGVQSHWRRS